MRRRRHASAWLAAAALTACGTAGVGRSDSQFRFDAVEVLPLGAGTGPVALAMADFNRDGRMDVASANRDGGSVSVMLGTGDGSFAGSSTFLLEPGAEPVGLVAAYLDGDGILDLAVADRSRDEVAVLRGTGAGTFTATTPVTFGGGAQVSGVVAADFNRDGRMDLAAVDRASGNVFVALGDGTGAYASPTTVNVSAGFRSSAVTAADFNRDGRPDLAVASGVNGDVALLLGDGVGGFAPAAFVTVDSGEQLAALTTADCNRDGATDLIVAGLLTSHVYVLLGNGAGAFAPPAAFLAGPDPLGVAAGDFDRDGRVDLVVALAGQGQVGVLPGNGDGTFRTSIHFGTGGSGTAAVAVGDPDGNGSFDVVVANRTSGELAVLLGPTREITASLTPAPAVAIGAGFGPASVVLEDFDRNGTLDLAVANRFRASLSVALGAGDGTFAAAIETPGLGLSPVALTAADFDRDGILDLATANSGGSSVTVLRGTGTGTFAVSATIPLPAGGQPSALVTGDFDRDGALDIAVANRILGSVSLARGQGDGTFFPPVTIAIDPAFRAGSMIAADLNADGRLDLALADDTSGNAAILFGDGLGSFGLPAIFTVDAGAPFGSLAAADANHSGGLDLILTEAAAGAAAVLLGNGSGAFGSAITSPAGTGASGVAAGDFDRDGRMDLVISRNAAGRVRLLLGLGEGTFTLGPDATAGGLGSTSVAVGDLNRDGVLDLVVVNSTSGSVGVLLGP